MGSMFGIWNSHIFTYSSQAKNTCLSSHSLSEKDATFTYTMVRWENRLSSGWSLWDSEKMMEPPDTLSTLGAKGLTQCLCCVFRGFSWTVHLHPTHSLHPTKVHTDLGRWDYLSQKGFYSWIPTYPPNQADQCQEAVLVQDTYSFHSDHKYFYRYTILLSFWRNNYTWIYAHSSVTSASAATLNQMTALFSLSVTVTTQSWWSRGTWCNSLK